MLDELGVTLEKIVIHRLVNGVFYASLYTVDSSGGAHVFDSRPSVSEISFDFGNSFSEESLLEILNNCIPPTFIIGIKVIAITIIPIPPNHWSIARHKSIDLGALSKLEIIVDPVVVIPDILSKKESVIESSRVEKIKGKEPNIAILNQERAVNKNACCRFNFLSWFKFVKKNKTPNIIEIIEPPIKEESISEYINWAIIGIIMEIPRIICKTPKVKKTVL